MHAPVCGMISSKFRDSALILPFLSNLSVFYYLQNVRIAGTTEYILDEIYAHDKLPKLCSRPIFKIPLLKLTLKILQFRIL